MIDKNSFKEVSLEKIEGNEPLPGNIYIKDIELSDEEMNVILEEMSHYRFKTKHNSSYTNWEHSECDDESSFTYLRTLDDLPKYHRPIYLIKDKHFYGLCVITTGSSRATFLVNGKSYGRTEVHDNESYGHVDNDDDYYYSMIKA